MAKWRKRPGVQDERMGPEPASTVLSPEQEAMAVAFRRHTLLALYDGLYALQARFRACPARRYTAISNVMASAACR